MVERGEDQLVEVDQAAEAHGELFQLPADGSQTARERRRGLVLTGLQGSQEVALNPGVCEERGVTGGQTAPMRRATLFLPISLRTVLSDSTTAEICPLRAPLRSAENGEYPWWLRQ